MGSDSIPTLSSRVLGRVRTPAEFRSRRKRRGVAAVEFAVIAPLFFMLLFGMIEFGRMIMVQQLLTQASREGARQAVLDGATSAQVEQAVEEYLASVSIPGTAASIAAYAGKPADKAGTGTPDVSGAARGQAVTVEISIPYREASWLPAPWFLGQAVIKAAATMRHE